MVKSVYVTARGDRYHARANCPKIEGPHKTARTMGYEVFEPEEVTLAEAQQQGKGVACPECEGQV